MTTVLLTYAGTSLAASALVLGLGVMRAMRRSASRAQPGAATATVEPLFVRHSAA